MPKAVSATKVEEVQVNTTFPKPAQNDMLALKDIFWIEVHSTDVQVAAILGSTLSDKQVNRITGGVNNGD